MRRKVSYEFQMPWGDENKSQSRDFKIYIKEVLLKVLIDEQAITQWQYEECLKQLKKGG